MTENSSEGLSTEGPRLTRILLLEKKTALSEICISGPVSVGGPLLKYRSEEKGSSLLGFFISKKHERLRSELLSEDKITNLLGFLT